jgi:hypothetical protein
MSRTRRSASERSGHGASVFTGDLRVFQYQDCELAALLRHVAGSPGLGLLRGLRPVRVPTVDSGPARHRPWLPAGRAAPVRFPRSPHTRSTGEVPSFAPAASPRVRRSPTPWPPSRRLPPVPESPAKRGCALPPDPCPPGWGRSDRLRGFGTGSLALHLPVSLAGPEPSGGASPSRRCRGCSHPALRSQGQAAPSFY